MRTWGQKNPKSQATNAKTYIPETAMVPVNKKIGPIFLHRSARSLIEKDTRKTPNAIKPIATARIGKVGTLNDLALKRFLGTLPAP